jgi:murein DD-endopeptidase MepM/ murein hydrolase activator NlpD
MGFGLAGSTVALSIDQAIDYTPPKPSLRDRFSHLSEIAHDIDWIPDLGTQIGSFTWFRGLATLSLLCGSAIALSPGFKALPGAVPVPLSGDAWEESRAQSIAPLAWGSDTGRRMASNDLVVSLNTTPERPTIDVTATLGQGDGFARLLERNGVGGSEARKIASMVSGVTSLGDIQPGTVMSLTLGERPSRDMARPVEYLAFRANFGMKLAFRRSGGALQMQRIPVAIDRTPLRLQGRIGDSLYRSARAAGVPAKAVAAYIQAIASKDLLNAAQSDARYDIIVEHARAETGETQVGKLLYAGLIAGNRQARLLQWTIGGRTEWYEASGVGQKRGGMTQPVQGARMSSGFGMRFHPILGYSRFHRGVDFAAVHGTPIRAVTDGVVAMAGRNGGNGNYVRLSHSGTLGSSYSHMSRIVVTPGMRVAQGQLLGYVGSTGLSTGPHLHFEVYRNGAAVNPRTVTFESRSLLSGAELAAFQSRLNAMLSIPVAGAQQMAAAPVAAGSQRLSR